MCYCRTEDSKRKRELGAEEHERFLGEGAS